MFIALPFDSDYPLLLVVVEKDVLYRRVESKVSLEIEVLSIAGEIVVYLDGSGI
jgi:hypothetical protein